MFSVANRYLRTLSISFTFSSWKILASSLRLGWIWIFRFAHSLNDENVGFSCCGRCCSLMLREITVVIKINIITTDATNASFNAWRSVSLLESLTVVSSSSFIKISRSMEKIKLCYKFNGFHFSILNIVCWIKEYMKVIRS